MDKSKQHETNHSAKNDGSEEIGEFGSDSRIYWDRQNRALARVKSSHGDWARKRREKENAARSEHIWKRVTYSLPREEAKAKAREFLTKYPKAAYWSEVESWRVLPDDVIEFTLRRLPTAD